MPPTRGALTAKTHIYRHRLDFPVERILLEKYVTPGARTLDVGTGATGRSALLATSLGARVTSIEVNPAAIAEFGESGARDCIDLAAADLLQLPFQDNTFRVALVALHGLDYVLDPDGRRRAFTELHRALQPGGLLIFNGFNPLGMVLSPTGLRAPGGLKARARYVLSGRFLKPTLVDVNGLELCQSTPRSTIREVCSCADLHLVSVSNLSGSTTSLTKISLFGTAPYYVFRKGESSGMGPDDQ